MAAGVQLQVRAGARPRAPGTRMLDLTGILAGVAFLVGSVLLAIRVDVLESREAGLPSEPPPSDVPPRAPPRLRLVQGAGG